MKNERRTGRQDAKRGREERHIGQFSTLTPTGRTVVNLRELLASEKVQATLNKLFDPNSSAEIERNSPK